MDINDCLAILSGRPTCNHDHTADNAAWCLECDAGSDAGGGAGNGAGAAGGQVLTLDPTVAEAAGIPAGQDDAQPEAKDGDGVENGDAENAGDAGNAGNAEAGGGLPARRDTAERRAAIQAELGSATLEELLQLFWRCQSERSATYNGYDRRLKSILESGDIALYPAVVAEVTAAFAVLSDTILVIKDLLRGHHERGVLSGLVGKVQDLEKAKLEITAAFHMDQVRRALARDGDEREAALLEDNIARNRGKRDALNAQINEALEDLRCEASDL